jgi:hypothetical protein
VVLCLGRGIVPKNNVYVVSWLIKENVLVRDFIYLMLASIHTKVLPKFALNLLRTNEQRWSGCLPQLLVVSSEILPPLVLIRSGGSPVNAESSRPMR